MKKYQRVNLEELSKIIPKDILIELYSKHSATYIYKKYDITKHALMLLIKYYNITPHSPSEASKMAHAENPMIYTGGKKYYNNGIIQRRLFPGTQPEGWVEGALKFTKEQTEIMLSKRGYRSPMQLQSGKNNYKNNFKAKYGVDNPMKVKDFFIKVNKGKYSKAEDDLFIELVAKYGKSNIIRNYRCDRYPFFCDFYIKSEDLFIECNYHWTHGGHPFDPESKDDDLKLKELQEKAKNSKYYQTAINVWTERDPLKRETARLNKLNYLEIF